MKTTRTQVTVVLLITLTIVACSKSDKSPNTNTSLAKDISIGQEVHEGDLTFKFTEAQPFTSGMQSSTQAAGEKEPSKTYHFKVKMVVKDSSTKDHILNNVNLIDISTPGTRVGGSVGSFLNAMNVVPNQEFTIEREVDSGSQDAIVFYIKIDKVDGQITFVGPYRLRFAQ